MATTLKLPNSLNRSHKDGVNNAILSHLSRFNTLISSFIILSPYPLPTPELLPSFYLPNFPSLPFLAPLILPLETFFISHVYHTSPCFAFSLSEGHYHYNQRQTSQFLPSQLSMWRYSLPSCQEKVGIFSPMEILNQISQRNILIHDEYVLYSY